MPLVAPDQSSTPIVPPLVEYEFSVNAFQDTLFDLTQMAEAENPIHASLHYFQ